jgi:hypothetical protein
MILVIRFDRNSVAGQDQDRPLRQYKMDGRTVCVHQP